MKFLKLNRKLAISFILLLLPTVLVGWVGLNQIGSLEYQLKGILTNWSELTIKQAKKDLLREFILFDKNLTETLKKETIKTLKKRLKEPTDERYNNKNQFAIFLDKNYHPLRGLPKTTQGTLRGITQILTSLSSSKKYKGNKFLNRLLAMKLKLDGLIPVEKKSVLGTLSNDPIIEAIKLYLLLPLSENKLVPTRGLIKNIRFFWEKKGSLTLQEQIILFTITTSAIYEIGRTLKPQKLFVETKKPLAVLGTILAKLNITALRKNRYGMIPLTYLNESLNLTESLVLKLSDLDLLEWLNNQKEKIWKYWDLSKRFTEYFSTTIRPLIPEIKKMGIGTSISFPTIKTYGEVVLIKRIKLADENQIFFCLFFKPGEVIKKRLRFLNLSLTKANIPFKVEIANKENIFSPNKTEKARTEDSYKRTSPILSPVFAGIEIVTSPKNLTYFLTNKRKTLFTKAMLLICLSLIAIAGGILLLKTVKREKDLINQKEMFVARVSHELKTPLSLIQLYSETLASGKVKNLNQSRTFSEIIKKEANSLNILISNILNFSKKQTLPKKVRLNPSSLLSEVFFLFKHQLDKEGFSFTKNLTSVNFNIYVNPEEFKQAIVNLIANSRKFSIKKKFISMGTHIDGSFLKIWVSDRGLGIPKNELNKIFDPFYRGTNSKQTRGVGLGLSIVKDFIFSCDGTISIQQRKNGGTRVIIKIPLA